MLSQINTEIVIILLLVFASAYMIGSYFFGFSRNQSSSLAAKKFIYFQEKYQALFISSMTPRQMVQIFFSSIIVAAVLVYFMSSSIALALLAAVVVWFLPGPVFEYLKQQRREKFEAGFPSTLDKMVSSSKAGLSLVQLFEVIAKHDSPPASQEFGRAVRDYKLGKDLGQIIDDMKERIGSPLFDLFATAILVNRDKGGNLPETLHTMSQSFKEIMRLDEKVTTASAEGRKGARVISLMPIFIFFFISIMQPSLIDLLTGSVIGWIIVGIAAVFYICGLVWMRKVLDIEV